jgi:hypothetical protein
MAVSASHEGEVFHLQFSRLRNDGSRQHVDRSFRRHDEAPVERGYVEVNTAKRSEGAIRLFSRLR